MDHQLECGCIELIRIIQPTDEERRNPKYVPRLEINSEAKKIISEKFQSPISILVYVGNTGVGKSKLASLTAGVLQREKYNQSLSPFLSGPDPKGVTHGVWMWREPLKDPNKSNKKGSILLLDCEGMGTLDQKTTANLYLFCMLISTAFAVVLRPARVERQQGERLQNALQGFANMKTPYVLPNLWLVPVELPHLMKNNKIISSNEWINEVLSVTECNNTLSTNENKLLETQYNYIRQMLPNINVANVSYLPICFRDDSQLADDIFTQLREASSECFYTSLSDVIRQLLKSGGKRLPGSYSNLLYVRPAELAHLMGDLIDIINADTSPNPDELIGKYLLERFEQEIVKKKIAEFQGNLLSTTKSYLKKNLRKRETETQMNDNNIILSNERNHLTKQYIKEITKLAEEKIYGPHSVLLTLELFKSSLDHVRKAMDEYQDPELLIEKIRSNFSTNDQNDQENKQKILSDDTEQRLEKITERINREDLINASISGSELQVDLEQCSECGRTGGIVSIIHSKEVCSSKRNGNYYRYNDQEDVMQKEMTTMTDFRKSYQLHQRHKHGSRARKYKKVIGHVHCQ
ncbi:unnamed protein product [Rotaria sordida]|uniref:Guanylate-binding protein N-terminal domain-containing protein n=1 Tax=Rotaria sordida TaxID=392033 RepID=A0A813X0B1_9BILA|nr:unnamed protein product [Rotaria sordida]